MALSHQRLKQPELVRSQLLAVVREILVEAGPQAVTLDAVSRRAGVSKGGLQHHFASKQALLDALADQLMEEFRARYEALLEAEPPSPTRHARAYVRACFDEAGEADGITQRAIGLLALTQPTCRQRWSALMQAALAADGPAGSTADRLLVCRLAADGFWFGQMLDVYALDAPRRAALLQHLLALCDGGAP